MRYSIMLQLVTGISLILLFAASLFAWIQNRQNPSQMNSEGRVENVDETL